MIHTLHESRSIFGRRLWRIRQCETKHPASFAADKSSLPIREDPRHIAIAPGLRATINPILAVPRQFRGRSRGPITPQPGYFSLGK